MTLDMHLLFYFTYDYPFALRDVSGCRFLLYTIIDRQDTNQGCHLSKPDGETKREHLSSNRDIGWMYRTMESFATKSLKIAAVVTAYW